MKRHPLLGFILSILTAAFLFVLSAAAQNNASATSTPWPTVTRRPSSTPWPTATRYVTNTRTPSFTRTASKTRTSSKTLTPSRTRTPTRTRYLSPTRTPTRPAGWLLYQNPAAGFQFLYPGDAVIDLDEANHFQLHLSITPGTNLVEKYLEQYATIYEGECGSVYGGETVGTLTINGYSFVQQQGSDAGAGQIHEWVAYSTVQGTMCISFNFILHSGNPANYDPPVPLFDKAAESAVFLQIMNTFSMLPATPTPTPPPTSYGVVFVRPNDKLNIRSGAGVGYPIIGKFNFDQTGIYRTGPSRLVGGYAWYQVQKPTGGTGWVHSYYLTELVDSAAFCSDSRVAALFAQLAQAVNNSDGKLFASLVSPVRGVDVRLWHSAAPIHYSKVQAASVFTNLSQKNWGAGPSGENTVGTFAKIIQPKLAEVLNASYESYCNDPKAAAMFALPWPSEYTNFNYYSLFKPGTPGIDLDYRQWMIGIDYVDGKPYIVVLIHIVWEP